MEASQEQSNLHACNTTMHLSDKETKKKYPRNDNLPAIEHFSNHDLNILLNKSSSLSPRNESATYKCSL